MTRTDITIADVRTGAPYFTLSLEVKTDWRGWECVYLPGIGTRDGYRVVGDGNRVLVSDYEVPAILRAAQVVLTTPTLNKAIKAGADPFFLGVAAALHPHSTGPVVLPDDGRSDFINGYEAGKRPGPVHAPSYEEVIKIWESVS